jgi:hypothetical protein
MLDTQFLSKESNVVSRIDALFFDKPSFIEPAT